MNPFQEIFAKMVEESSIQIASESNQATQSQETEIIVYCKIKNFDGLQKASKIETHEQLESEFKNGVRCRVRHTAKASVVATEVTEEGSQSNELNADSYCFTFKLKTGSKEGFESNKEYSVEVDQDFFEGFRSIAEQRLLKTRYEFASDTITLTYADGDEKHTIEIPDIKYEVDVYFDKNGVVCEWCKIDIEVDAILDYLAQHHPDLQNIKLNVKISHLPFEPSDTILTLSATEDQQAFVDSLWKDHFRLPPNAVEAPIATEAPVVTDAPEVEQT